MGTDEDVRELLQRLTPDPELRVDVDVVRRRVRRRRTRTSVVAAALSVGVVVGGVSIVAMANGGDEPAPTERPSNPTPPETSAPGWQRLPDVPLSPRWGSFTVWTGSEFLVLGGYDRSFVGGPAPIPTLADGAAFDPDTSTWRPIAPAPVDLGEQVDSTLVGDTLVVAYWDRWLAYDIGDDRWRTMPEPPRELQQVTMASSRGRVYALGVYVEEGEAPVQVLDLATERWSELPESPHLPALNQRTLVTTPEGLVVMGDDYFPRQAGNKSEDAHAELWDGTSWARYGDSDVQGYCWHWTGQRIISACRHTQHNGVLDPATGKWSTIPPAPRGHRHRLQVAGWPTADGPVVFSDGFLYDDVTGVSRPVPTPDRAVGHGGVALGSGRLAIFGGYRIEPGQEYSRVMDVEPTNDAWIYVVE